MADFVSATHTADCTVWLDISCQCPPETDPANAGVKFPQPGAITSLRNVGRPVLSDWDRYLAANGYRGIPLDRRMAAGLVQIPNDGKQHYVLFSGHLLYLPSAAGPNAILTYASLQASPNPFNVVDMLLAFRITSLTIYPRSGRVARDQGAGLP